MLALLLSATFLSAAVAKLHDPWQLRLTVRELLPSWPRYLTHVIAAAVIALELLVPVLFSSGPRALGIGAAVGTALLAGAFACAFLLSRRLPHAVLCHCFGRLHAVALSGWTLLVSLVLLGGALMWTRATGNVATFGVYPLRLLALAPTALVVAAHRIRIPASKEAEP